MTAHCDTVELMNKVLDGEADEKDKQDLTLHLKKCGACRKHFEELQKTAAIVQSVSGIQAPENFKSKLMERLPGENRTSKARRWLQRHPILTAAALFLIFMTSYFFSLWQGPGQVSVLGEGHVKQGNHVVIVPKGEVIRGDLIVRNSDVKIEGKVKGNVTVINGNKYLASAGQVTGHIREVNKVMGWIWYQIKHLFTGWAPPYEIRRLGL